MAECSLHGLVCEKFRRKYYFFIGKKDSTYRDLAMCCPISIPGKFPRTFRTLLPYPYPGFVSVPFPIDCL